MTCFVGSGNSADLSDEVLADRRAEKKDEFDPRWREVEAIFCTLEGLGIFMLDMNPSYVSFDD